MLIVQKYGGSSVADKDRIENVAKRIHETKKGTKVVKYERSRAYERAMFELLIFFFKQLCPTLSEQPYKSTDRWRRYIILPGSSR